MCIISPKLVEVASNANIKVITLADVEKISGEAGDFTVTLRVKPRYIDIDKCTGCGDCTAKCPVKVPNPYDAMLGITRNIRVPFPQAVPGAAFIDPTTCRYFTKGKCQNCVKVCQAKAIDFEQQEKIEEIRVGSVVLAPASNPSTPSSSRNTGTGSTRTSLLRWSSSVSWGPTDPPPSTWSAPPTRRKYASWPSFSAWARATAWWTGVTAPASAACTPPSSP